VSEATASADAALHRDGDWPAALRLRAQLAQDVQQPALAASYLERALLLDPHDHAAREAYLEVLELLGRSGELAEQRLLRIQTRQMKNDLTHLGGLAAARPWDDAVRVQAAELCRKLGQRDNARNWFRAALTCNPQNLEARRGLELIDGIQR
jgi:tetratricopeptide (TPR) repeat protein